MFFTILLFSFVIINNADHQSLQPAINTSQTSQSHSESNLLSKILAHKNNDQNDQALIDIIDKLDPAQVANVITSLQPAINTSQTSQSHSESTLLSKILAHKNNDQNDQALIDIIDKLDPAQVANVITLVEALLAESQAELERITLASTNADAAFSDAENAYNTAGMNKINGDAAAKLDLDNGIADLQATHDAIVTALQGDLDNALSVKESAMLAKQEANSVLNQEQNRLNHEISSLTHIISLLQGITTTAELPTSCRDVNGGSGVYNIDPDGSDGPKDPVEVYCEMSIDGGGWTVIGYLRNSAQWDYGVFDDNGVVGNVDGGFSTGSTMKNNVNLNGVLYNQKLVVYLHLVENGVDLGTQWMVNSRNDALPFSQIKEPNNWSYYDSFGYSYSSAGNTCTHGCDTYRAFGMFRSYPFAGTQTEDHGCRDGNNICWQQRSMNCNVGDARCSLLTGPGEGVIYAVRNNL